MKFWNRSVFGHSTFILCTVLLATALILAPGLPAVNAQAPDNVAIGDGPEMLEVPYASGVTSSSAETVEPATLGGGLFLYVPQVTVAP